MECRRVRRRVLPAATLALVALAAGRPPGIAAEAEDPQPPPRTVLVLSGGGARGMAHVGVLEVLEEMGVPFDAIVGTSMGAIVGGMYASGISPQQMRERLKEIDWVDAFNDEPPRKHVPFRRKQEDHVPLFKFEGGFNRDGFSLPSGMVAGQKLNFILRTMLLHTAAVDSFDDLPVPFRAVATDLDSGELVVIDHGDLAGALRASMAFPVLFTPVKYDGRLLIDGGVVSNLSLDVALAMGAERIIAVDVGSRMESMDKENPSMMQVLRRTQSIQSKAIRAEIMELLREQDILIVPQLDGVVSFIDFDELDRAAELGRQAALAAQDRLRELAVPPSQHAPFIERQRAGTQMPALPIGEITISGLNRVPPERILQRLETRPGELLDLERLRADLERVYLIGEFQTVEFRILPDDAGQQNLIIDVEEKSWGPWYTRGGLGLESDFRGTGNFVANVLLRRSEVNRLGAEWRTFVAFGQVDEVLTDLYQPLSQAGTWFAGAGLRLRRDDDERVFVGEEMVNAKTKSILYGLDLGRALGYWGEIRLGVRLGQTDNEVADVDLGTSDLGAYQFSLAMDRLDNPYFPRHGSYGELSARVARDALGADDEYERLEFRGVSAGSFGRNTLIGSLWLGSDLDSDLPFYDDFELGGFLHLSGLAPDQLSGSDVAHAALILLRRVNREPGPFSTNYYIGASIEAGNAWRPDDPVTLISLRAAGSLFIGADTLLGPLYFAYGKAEGERGTFYFYLGRLF